MKRIILIGAGALLMTALWAPGAWAFGWKDVRKMHAEGIADSLIIVKIDHSGEAFHLSAGNIRDLQRAGVSDAVISAMLKTEDRYQNTPYAYFEPAYYWPSFWDTRAYLGFGFGYGWRHYPYYGGFGYRPYFERHRFDSFHGLAYRGLYGGGHYSGVRR